MIAAVPVLPVADIANASAFYRKKLGFTIDHAGEGYAVLQRDGIEVHLWAATDRRWQARAGNPPIVSGAETFLAGTASCRVRVTGIAALYAACRGADIGHPNGPLADKPYGLREFAVLDLDGNLITFFVPIGRDDPADQG
jgi:catechol 2,3-dioxygenase-like lactoylglutathione lyase family enzyme